MFEFLHLQPEERQTFRRHWQVPMHIAIAAPDHVVVEQVVVI
jgi:hypothetical protein